jgi:hypothetical protein
MDTVKIPLSQPVDIAILQAQRDLHTVLTDIWGFRETTIADGVPPATVDATIDESPTLQLAHDLGNLAKHGQLNRDGRSGGRPIFGPPQAESGSVGTPTTFHQSALLNGTERSAVGVADDALGSGSPTSVYGP